MGRRKPSNEAVVRLEFALLMPTDAAAVLADLRWCERCRAWVDKWHKCPDDEDDS